MFVDLFVMYYDVHGRAETRLVEHPERHHTDFMTFWNDIRETSSQLCGQYNGRGPARQLQLCGGSRNIDNYNCIIVPNRPFRVMNLDNVAFRTQEECLEDDAAMRLVLFFDAVQQEDVHTAAGAVASRTLKIWSSYF